MTNQLMLCIDMESVLTPEIWQEVARIAQVPELMLTTRDIADSDALMKHRLEHLQKNNITFSKIQEIIAHIDPLPGSVDFLDWARGQIPVIILSDSFMELAQPLLDKMGNPTIFCHQLVVQNDAIIDYSHRIENPKVEAVKRFQELNFEVIATGDSFNDIGMIHQAEYGYLFNPADKVQEQYTDIAIVKNFDELKQKIQQARGR